MNQTNFLKIAYLHGISKAAGERNLSEEDIGLLEKYALSPGGVWSKAKAFFGRGAKEVAPVAEGMVAKKGPAYGSLGEASVAEAVAKKPYGAPQMASKQPAQVPAEMRAGYKPTAPAATQGGAGAGYSGGTVETIQTAPVVSRQSGGSVQNLPPRPTPSAAPAPKPAAPAAPAAPASQSAAQAPQMSTQMPAKPGFQAPARIQGEGYLKHRARVRAARKTYKTQAATPKLVTKQEAQTSRELAKSQVQAQKEYVQRQSQAALAKEQQALQAAQAEQQAAVGAKKMPSREPAPVPTTAPANVEKATAKVKETAKTKADEAAAGAAGGTAKGEVEAVKGTQAAKETGAKAEENLAQRYEESRGAMSKGRREQLGEIERAGTGGGLGFGATTLAPTALGAGVGYAADGREGAMIGAGVGLGARAGMGPVLKRLREARGFQKMLGGAAGKAPSMGEYMATPVGRKALWGAGIAGGAGAGAGYAAGQAFPPPEPDHWYSGLGVGVSPQMMQGVGQTALPYLANRYGLDPAALQGLGAQYGLAPPQMQTGRY